MNERTQMNILVTLDANYILPLRVLLHSLVTADTQTFYTVYVAHASLTQADFERIHKGLPQERCALRPIEVAPALLEDAPVLRRLSKATYYRLIAPSFLPRDVDRVLYLDPDITVIRSLVPFYNMDMRGKCFAASGHLGPFGDRFNRRRLHIRRNAEYVNAGVLLMDVRSLREMDNNEQIFDFVRRNARRLYLGDQDVLNAFYDGSIQIVDARVYNLDEKMFKKMQEKGTLNARWVREHTAIIHYDGSKKPWNEPYDGLLGDYFFACRKDLEAQIGEPV